MDEWFYRCECCSKEFTNTKNIAKDINRLRGCNFAKLQHCKKKNRSFVGGALFILCDKCGDHYCKECDCLKSSCICCGLCKKIPRSCICCKSCKNLPGECKCISIKTACKRFK
jgi:hypothetical protein